MLWFDGSSLALALALALGELSCCLCCRQPLLLMPPPQRPQGHNLAMQGWGVGRCYIVICCGWPALHTTPVLPDHRAFLVRPTPPAVLDGTVPRSLVTSGLHRTKAP
ncbi:hypothetical protein V8F33_001390 [Rhypophila sp. PSN 637]